MAGAPTAVRSSCALCAPLWDSGLPPPLNYSCCSPKSRLDEDELERKRGKKTLQALYALGATINAAGTKALQGSRWVARR